ncbi:MAG: hypothetical protein ABIN97_12215 [Ginsengibacter sp.]
MKKYILSILVVSGCIVACENKDNKEETKTISSTGSVALPYKADYTTEFTNDVSDSDLLVALNSYKYWETGDMNALRSTMGDSVTFLLSGGWKFNGATDSLMKIISTYRDSLSSVSINMITWLKNHSAKDSADWINVWYKEIDTYKTGKVDSAEYVDDNLMKNGKIIYTSSHRQVLK